MTSVGRYQILDQLGRGAMGVVYKAFDPAIGRTVAIKAIRLGDFADPEERGRVRERLLREAQSAGLLTDPSIVTIYDVLEEENNAFIFMEFVCGRSLDALLREGAVPPLHELLGYLRQVAHALDYAHRRGIIHRDIKPGNILLAEVDDDRQRLAKVADFGVAKFISQETTHSGTMMGTPSYMSPEQIQGLISDGRADQFSLAVVVYELLTGQKPFTAEGLSALFYQICRVSPKPAHEVQSSMPPAVSSVLTKALSKEPQDRYTSCGEFMEALAIATDDTIPMARLAAAASMAVSPVLISSSAHADETIEQPVPPAVELPPLPRRRQSDEVGIFQSDEPPGRSRWLLPLLFTLAACVVFALVVYYTQAAGKTSAVTSKNQPIIAAPLPGTKSSTPPPALSQPSAGTKPSLDSSVRKPEPPTPSPMHPALPISDEAEILTQPAGAVVIIDGREDLKCTAPCDMSLPAGRHTLQASLDGYNTAQRVFNLPDESDLNITLIRKEGALVITTTPAGSIVIVDGKEYGKSPLTLHLLAGVHQLVLVNGDQRHEESVTIENDAFEARSFHW